MRFNVAQLLKLPVGEQRSYTFDERLSDSVEPQLTLPVAGSAKLMRLNQGILARVRATTAMRLDCSRCLEPFDLAVELAFEECFVPTIDIQTGLPFKADDIDPADVFYIDENHMLDLEEAIRQHSLLAIPMMPLHDPRCAGLCPICGVSMNESPNHGHEQSSIDERLRPLQRLLDRAAGDPGAND